MGRGDVAHASPWPFPYYENPFLPIKRFCVYPLALTVALSCALSGQAQQDTPQVENRVDSILAQMTLDEKLDYISGEPINFASLKGVFNIK